MSESGAALHFALNDKELRRQARELHVRLTQRRTASLMEEIAAYGIAATMRRFEKGQGPGGVTWPLSMRARMEDGQTLVDSGRLLNYLGTNITAASAEWGSNTLYAAIHQFGGTITAKTARGLRFQCADGKWATKRSVTIPARPFLGIDAVDEAEIVAIADDWLKGLIPA